MSRNARPVVTWIGDLLLVAVGLVTLVVGLFTPVPSGWFAYQPLADTTFTISRGIFVSNATVTGAVILAVGLLGIAFLTGWKAGRRRRA